MVMMCEMEGPEAGQGQLCTRPRSGVEEVAGRQVVAEEREECEQISLRSCL